MNGIAQVLIVVALVWAAGLVVAPAALVAKVAFERVAVVLEGVQ